MEELNKKMVVMLQFMCYVLFTPSKYGPAMYCNICHNAYYSVL